MGDSVIANMWSRPMRSHYDASATSAPDCQQPVPGEVQRCNRSTVSAVRQDSQLAVRSHRLVISETSRVGPRLFDERKELRRLQRRAEVKSLVLIACQLRQKGELLWGIRAIRDHFEVQAVCQ